MKGAEAQNKLLAAYLGWGLVSVAAVALFAGSVTVAVFKRELNTWLLFIILLEGFAYIGSASMGRHSLVILKKSMGKTVSIRDFLLSQFAFITVPLTYPKLKKELEDYLRTAENGDGTLKTG